MTGTAASCAALGEQKQRWARSLRQLRQEGQHNSKSNLLVELRLLTAPNFVNAYEESKIHSCGEQTYRDQHGGPHAAAEDD